MRKIKTNIMKHFYVFVSLIIFSFSILPVSMINGDVLNNDFNDESLFWHISRRYEEIESDQLLSYIEEYLNMMPQLVMITMAGECEKSGFTMDREVKTTGGAFNDILIKDSGQLVAELRRKYTGLTKYLVYLKEKTGRYSGFIDDNGNLHFLLYCSSKKLIEVILNGDFIENFVVSLIVKPESVIMVDPATGNSSVLFSRNGLIRKWITGRKEGSYLKLIHQKRISRRTVMESAEIWGREFKLEIFYPLFSAKALFMFIGLLVVVLSTILLIGLIIYSLLTIKHAEVVKMNKELSGNEKRFDNIIEEIDRKIESISETSEKETVPESTKEGADEIKASEDQGKTPEDENLEDFERDGVHIKKLDS